MRLDRLRKILLGEGLYKECSTEFGMITHADLEHRIPQLRKLGFTHVTANDLVGLCHLKEIPQHRLKELYGYITSTIPQLPKIATPEEELAIIRRSIAKTMFAIDKLQQTKVNITQPKNVIEWQKLFDRMEANLKQLKGWEQERVKRKVVENDSPLPITKKSRAPFSHGYVLDNVNITVRPSTIPNAGNGLFSLREFKKGEVITEYSGEVISHAEASLDKGPEYRSHFRSLESMSTVLAGLKEPVMGQGAASFPNDIRARSRYNSEFYTRWDESNGRNRVYIKAIKPIQPGEEIFVSYGATYWSKYPNAPPMQS
jgi:hypothetical protein